ncbi:hypothetical protein MCP1_310015 [Candidatus Terasakiella magnetica]|nr:hypothetical protein MCP1_310015 [Candidatus Terasakiella magnetica]
MQEGRFERRALNPARDRDQPPLQTAAKLAYNSGAKTARASLAEAASVLPFRTNPFFISEAARQALPFHPT